MHFSVGVEWFLWEDFIAWTLFDEDWDTLFGTCVCMAGPGRALGMGMCAQLWSRAQVCSNCTYSVSHRKGYHT